MTPIETLKQRLESRKKEYADRKEWFMIEVKNDINSSNFEKNAIGSLTTMIELKSEIETLELAIKMIDIQYGGKTK
jgi:archaellum component FlaC